MLQEWCCFCCVCSIQLLHLCVCWFCCVCSIQLCHFVIILGTYKYIHISKDTHTHTHNTQKTEIVYYTQVCCIRMLLLAQQDTCWLCSRCISLSLPLSLCLSVCLFFSLSLPISLSVCVCARVLCCCFREE